MRRDNIDFSTTKIGPLFRAMFFPTLIGMIFTTLITVLDGMFVGHGVGPRGIAAVNIVAPLYLVSSGIGLMFGIGASVVAGIRLAEHNVKAARIIMTQGFIASTLMALAIVVTIIAMPDRSLQILGSNDDLHDYAIDYMLPLSPAFLFVMIQCIGMMLIRLDGSPKYAMWCQAIPSLLNIILDYIMIFPLGWGVKGAAIATSISCILGGLMAFAYFIFGSRTLKFYRLKFSCKSVCLTLRNVGYMIKIGLSTFLAEIAMGIMMVVGNYMFMIRLGSQGVAAYAIACYLFPVVFSIANAVAQSAQPIISFNYGAGQQGRVSDALRVSLATAIVCGATVSLATCFGAKYIVMAFLNPGAPAFDIAVDGLPIFASCSLFFSINVTFIGYYQSIEKAMRPILYTLLRGIVLLIPAFICLPRLLGDTGLWAAIPVAEFLTMTLIITLYLRQK